MSTTAISPKIVRYILLAEMTLVIIEPIAGVHDHNQPRIWIGTEFIPTSSNGVSSIDFNTVKGCDITEFLSITGQQVKEDQKAFTQALQNYVDKEPAVIYQFSKDVKYHRFIPQ